MVNSYTLGRAELRRLLTIGLASAIALVLAVGGMVAYSAQVIDRLQVRTESDLVQRRVDRTLQGLRENVVSATVWNEADVHARAGDQAWMQINFGDYYADYMDQPVTVVFSGDGRLIYASRNSEAVPPASEAAFAKAAAPLAAEVRKLAVNRRWTSDGRRVTGLKASASREGVVMVGRAPYFISVTNVVPEDPAHVTSGDLEPLVVSGRSVADFVPSLAQDLALTAPKLDLSTKPAGAGVAPLHGPRGEVLGHITWTPSRPGATLIMAAVPGLTVMLAIALAGLIGGGLRVRRLVRDLSRHERALARSHDEAQAANAAKSQFLANMSHELRTPLNGVIAMTELLESRQTDTRCREMARTIVSSSRTLEHLINDILDVSRIEAGQMRFEAAPFALAPLLRTIADLHAATAASSRVRLSLDIDPRADGRYEGDQTRVGQIVSNLVNNAVKFTKSGVVRIAARHGARGLRIIVSDTGIGFDRATAGRLFQRFEQAEASTSRRFGGAGLGLSISMSLAQMMGGRIAVRSTPGRGSTFVAYLPLPQVEERATKRAASPAAAAQPTGLRVLIADDNPVNRRVVSMILEPLGVRSTLVEDGAQALAEASTGAYDLVLMDVQMPVMDGLTATRRLREHEAATGQPRTPVIAVTANAMAEDIARSLEAGSDLHIAKPIRPTSLIEAIQAVTSGEAARHAAPGVNKSRR